MTPPPDSDKDCGSNSGPSRLPPIFWLMIVFSALCIAAGAFVGFFGARVWAPRNTPQPQPPSANQPMLGKPPAHS